MKILIGNDHRGVELKNKLEKYLTSKNYTVDNLGCNSTKSIDYPDIAFKLCKKVQNSDNLGILICGTGIGMSIAANKVKGIRCAKVSNKEEAKLAREHNNANVIAISANLSFMQAKKMIELFINTSFSADEKHHRRIDMISKFEGNNA